jgi:catechol 2,3-dioxygenase-like lactoylglutathione lyase family enzyme
MTETENAPDTAGIGTHIVCQIALVVEDIETVAAAYSDILGLPMPEVRETDPEVAQAMYRGQPTDARAKLAFFDLGQVSLELIEPVGAPSIWQEVLDEQGEGVHHIAFHVKGTDQVVAYLEGKGIGVSQQGHYTGGMYTYVDSTPQLKVVLELLENF